MSRAFVREPDDPAPRCGGRSGCGALGEAVTRATLQAHLPAVVAASLGPEAYACPDPECAVAYFDSTGLHVGVDQLKGPAWPKLRDAPLCACFGVREDEIAAWASGGHTDRMRDFLKRCEGPEARCYSRSWRGRSCVADARRVFMANREGP